MYQLKQGEIEEIHVEITKLIADTKKLNVESNNMSREIFWYPVAVATGLIGVVATVTTLIVKLI